MSARSGSVIIEAVQPELDSGRYAVKRVAGEQVEVQADIFKEGHDVLVAVVRWRQRTPLAKATDWREVPMRPLGNDRFAGTFPLSHPGRYEFTVEAWPELFATWASELQRKVDAGRDVKSELMEGAALLQAAASRAEALHPHDAQRLSEAAKRLAAGPSPQTFEVALAAHTSEWAARYPDRSIATRYDRVLEIFADREKARLGAWYEFFPRSATRDGQKHGTFKDAQRWLPEIQSLGFDVIYFPPIHPIGRTARKGKNNTLSATETDVGSPWAIGATEGGHKAIHPALGTLSDFNAFRQAAEGRGIEVALDLAFQCSPDHPYVREHPEWFLQRPDGTIKTAENPPKRYEDIVNFDWMGPAREALWNELRSVVLYWVDNGVRIFRVDNPHTKPLAFWAWLIREVQNLHPDVLFLSEAFTRPKVMKALAKAGFSQSYTYFTWRNDKAELQDYLTELTSPPVADYLRGNLWPNTPDILPETLQMGGSAIFRIRVALAATLSSSYGIYSGFELCEGRGIPGTEEYQDSEKYQLVAWDPERPDNIRPFIARLNQIRREQRALQGYDNLRFYSCSNDRVLFYGKRSPDGRNQVLVAVSLDPHEAQEATLEVPLEALGIAPGGSYSVHELMQDQRALWQGSRVQIQLTPEAPAAIWTVSRFKRREHAFDYYD